MERGRSDAGVEAFVEFQALSVKPSTPALLDDAGVGTIPDTDVHQLQPHGAPSINSVTPGAPEQSDEDTLLHPDTLASVYSRVEFIRGK